MTSYVASYINAISESNYGEPHLFVPLLTVQTSTRRPLCRLTFETHLVRISLMDIIPSCSASLLFLGADFIGGMVAAMYVEDLPPSTMD